MLKRLSYLSYAAGYLFETKILRKEIPFIGGLVINEKCNLHCRHCNVANRAIPDLSYEDIKRGLKDFYDRGIRSVFIEGGEPVLWKDGAYGLEDVIKLARETGFQLVSVYTNGTFPINFSTDSVFVSLDGLKATTNELRGSGENIYDKILENIKNSAHPNIIINYTINSKNEGEIEAFCAEMAPIKRVRGVFFYFHTPYAGIDELFMDLEKKREIIKRILALKKKGRKIFNSAACLEGIYRDDWERPSKICCVYAGNKTYECCRALGNEEACGNCGYLGYPEIIHILKLRPSSIVSAFNYLPRRA